MRSLVILDGLKGLQADEEVTAKQIVQWIIGALEVTSELPDFTITSAGKVSSALFKHLHLKTMKVDFPFVKRSYTGNMLRVVEAVGRIFDATNENEISLHCWIQISQFLNDLQKHCTNGIFMLVSGRISVMLLKKMIAMPSFDAKKDIIDTMLLYYKCGSTVAKRGVNQKEKKFTHVVTQCMDCCDVLITLIGENLIFSSDAFFPVTSEILFSAIKYGDAVALKIYWKAVHFVLFSNDQTAKTNMLTFLMRLEVIENWVIHISREKSQNFRILILKVLKAVLQYSRDTKVPFEIDWIIVFLHTLYWHINAQDLFVMEAEGEEQDQRSKSCKILEKAVDVHLRHNDMVDLFPARQESEHVLRFRNVIKGNVDFVSCEILFHLLRKHVSDRPAMCPVLILFIDSAAKTMAAESYYSADYVSLIKTTLKHFNYVKHYPELLCRLIKTFNLPTAKHDTMFNKEIMSIVPKAFLRCNLYGTAIELLEVLKALGYEDGKILALLETVVEAEVTDGSRTKENLTLFLAIHDVFNVFKAMHPDDRTTLFLHFKRRYGGASGDVKVLYATVMMHMLATFHSTSDKFVGDASNTTEKEASILHRFLSKEIEAAEILSFASVDLGIAICVYYSTFDTEPAGRELRLSLYRLSANSIEFRLNYELDVQKRANINDVLLLTKFWRCAINVFKGRVPDNADPSVILECYPRIEIHLVAQAEEFLSTILEHGNEADKYQFFAACVTTLVFCVKMRKVNPIVNKLFKYIARSGSSSDSNIIASIIFLKNLELYFDNSHQPNVLLDVQPNLYKKHLKNKDPIYRKGLMDVLNYKINACRVDATRKSLEKLRQCLQQNPIPNDNVPEREMNRDEGQDAMDRDEESNEEVDRQNVISDRSK